MFVPLCLFLLHSAAPQASADLALEHSFFAALDGDENVKLYWNVSTTEKEINFTVEAKTTGWIGFGISSGNGKMKGADIVIGWVKDGQSYFKDRHGDEDEYVMPAVDSQQNYHLISLTEESGKTTMKFSRKLDTCDSPDDIKIEAGTTKVIYAYHPEDPSSENRIPGHSNSNRGSRSLLLLNSLEEIPTLPSDTQAFDILHDKMAIPEGRTNYMCAVFEMPRFNETHHMIKVEPVIQAGHEGVVHHMLLYECSDTFPDHHLNFSGHCYRNMPPAVGDCAGGTPVAAWAIGGKEFYYPEHAGFPLGRADSPKVVILEIHYDNPNDVKGLIDSSGMRIYHTKQLRKYDAGVLEVGAGVDSTMLIPPRQKDFQINGFCTEDCSIKGFNSTKLPNGGINIFATLLHTHLAGRKTWLRHIRNGEELPEIARDNHYDFNFQEYHSLRNEVHVKPGDTMINVCIYNTEDRATATKGSLSTTDEMCLSFVLYYPKVSVTKCMSRERPAYNAWFKKYYKKGDDKSNPRWWTDTVNTGLKDAYQDADQVVARCLGRANEPIQGIDRELTPKPVITTPYKPEAVCEIAVAMGNRVTPGYLILLTSLMYLFAFAG